MKKRAQHRSKRKDANAVKKLAHYTAPASSAKEEDGWRSRRERSHSMHKGLSINAKYV